MCIYTVKIQKKKILKGGVRLHRTSHKLSVSGVKDTAKPIKI